MPRGRFPTGTVLTTFNVSVSSTVMVLSFSLLINAVPAKAGLARRNEVTVNFQTRRIIEQPLLLLISLLTFGFWLVIAERIGQIFRMQKSVLGRDRDERAGTGKQDRLAKLAVPAPKVHAL